MHKDCVVCGYLCCPRYGFRDYYVNEKTNCEKSLRRVRLQQILTMSNNKKNLTKDERVEYRKELWNNTDLVDIAILNRSINYKIKEDE